MKNLHLLLSVIISSSSFSQNKPNKEQLDINGVPVSENYQSLKGPIIKDLPFSTVSYDSVRPITELNTTNNAEAYPWISPDGLKIYYTSGSASNALYFSQRPNTSSFFGGGGPVPITVSNPTSYWLSANELNVYIATTNLLYFANRTSTTTPFSIATMINLTGMPISPSSLKGASLDPSENTLLICIFSGSGNFIYEFTRTSATSFNYVSSLPVPAGFLATPGQLSKNGLNYYMGVDPGTGKTELYEFSRTSTLTPFSSSSFMQITGINDPLVWNFQPSVSDSLKWVAFARNSNNMWTGNDLYIARKGNLVTSVLTSSAILPVLNIYPNPSNSCFTINTGEILQDAELKIYDIRGIEVAQFHHLSGKEFKFYRNGLAAGYYFMTLSENNKQLAKEKLLIVD